ACTIVANTPRACALLASAYPEHAAKMTSITNGYDPELFEPNHVLPLSGSTIEIVHTGSIYANRSPNPFLDSVQRLDPVALAGRPLRVRFIGDVVDNGQRHDIQSKICEVSTAKVSLEDLLPHCDSTRAMVHADLLLLLDTPGRRAGIPAKLYEY